MASQENGRLQEIVAMWPVLPDRARDVIHTLAVVLLDEADYRAVQRAVEALAWKGPDVSGSSTPK